jgi:hypothetical protein
MILVTIIVTAFIVLISICFGYFLGVIRNRNGQVYDEEERGRR